MTGFDCEYQLNANCEFFYNSQSFDNAIITAHHTQLHQHSQSLDSQCRQNPQNAIIKPRIKNRSYGNVYGICTCTACTLICIIILLREEPIQSHTHKADGCTLLHLRYIDSAFASALPFSNPVCGVFELQRKLGTRRHASLSQWGSSLTSELSRGRNSSWSPWSSSLSLCMCVCVCVCVCEREREREREWVRWEEGH